MLVFKGRLAMTLNDFMGVAKKNRLDPAKFRFRDEPALWRNFWSRPAGYTEDLFAKGEVSPVLG